MSAAAAPQAFFAPWGEAPHGQRLCLWHAPASAALKGVVVHVHAFAEEMNKSRRMAALQARALAAAGYAVLQFDLLGCGDSDGEFSDASWPAWVDDTVRACELALARCRQQWPASNPAAQAWLWGHRAGCLLACAAAARLPDRWNMLFWQPTPAGRQVLQQFLRLERAATLVRAPGAGAATRTAKAALADGERAEVAGYVLDPDLTRGLEAARLDPPARAARLAWLDLATDAAAAAAALAEPPPATASAVQAWAAAGWATARHVAAGPAFWQTTEIEEAPALIESTLAALQEGAA